ncbi:MAG: ribose-phosphate pyrophosphokinase [Armatimonadetes bacterium]|nr:ribose-phosphate pyrophosphokinase [Armatimonadota bacterium]MDW8121408.1 ribose-phosphate pyrophosphokinase [Armatimonadota bacterium]
MGSTLKLFSGTANPELAKAVAEHLGEPLGNVLIARFSDGEIRVQVRENIRGADVFLIQPTCPPVNENLMELLVMIDACKRASADRVVAVIPYYGYARQDRKVRPREPISAKLVANLLTIAGADRVFSVDLHAGQIQGFFDIPVDNVPAGPLLAKYLKEKGVADKDTVVVSPDVGGVERATIFGRMINAGIAIFIKHRPDVNRSEMVAIIGEVKGKRAILVDDLVDTGGTIVQAATALVERGAREVYACCTHPVLSGSAVDILKSSPIKELVVTDTIPIPKEKRFDRLTVLSVASLVAQAIRNIHENKSVSALIQEG